MRKKLYLLTLVLVISTSSTLPAIAAENTEATTEGISETEDYDTLKSNYESLLADYEELEEKYNEALAELESLKAQETDQPEYDINGTVNDVTDTTFTVTTDKGNQYTFNLNDFELNIGETVSFKYVGEIDSSQEIQPGVAKDLSVTAAAPAGAEYETGITYEQLSRTPDDYTGEKVKFSGTVIQVVEDTSSDEIQIRLAVDDNYDTILLCGYDKTIVESRVLEDDWITIYGTSLGLISYQSTMGGTITIPAVYIDRIDQ